MLSSSHLTVPLTAIAHDWALQFAAEQATPQKGKRVYLNTLAVWVVHRYLKWLQIDTDLESSDSWNPGLNALLDRADLVLPALGRLECRPVLPNETKFDLPLEVSHDSLGYVVVQLDEALQHGELLGFAPQSAIAEDCETLPLTALQPLDQLMEYVSELETRTAVAASSLGMEVVTQLGRWLQQVQPYYEMGWQSVEALLGHTPNFAFRGAAVRRAKQLALPNDRSSLHSSTSQRPNRDRLTQLAFVVSVTPESSTQLCIHLHICNLGEQAELPPQLRLRVLTETGEVFREVASRENDTFMQYEFTGQQGEQFSVEIGLGDAQTRETFVI
jgi:Protein of unknown function (DUF1822)